MRCSSYCVSKFYDLKNLVKYLNKKENCHSQIFGDAVHIKIASVEIFVFDFGCIVIWGSSEDSEREIIQEYSSFAEGLVKDSFLDFIYFDYDYESNKTYIDEEQNKIILHQDSVFIKLSISYALAQSIKLESLELSVSNLLESTNSIHKDLYDNGSVKLSKKEISKQIGLLFSERYLVNLHSDILDTPEFFWRRPSFEPLYLMTAEFQDIQVRQNILNHRLNMIYELYNVLSNELNYKHSTRLEIIIIVLIAIEVIMALITNDNVTKFVQIIFNYLH
ncbi:RMD1 family protein [Rickettsia endosymbiont of Cardiosporidium cionae]|uniref:RMD1 family protein n=1 Tax=Rickettsia endosymbiont of Cardiosporidium cionae TaxID=2777155 RepID=UPI001893B624|nr:RMD1 family protein [Rickettsia endosymbiont of Cardiosporidium cionae]KAF8818217.1 ribonuclease D [Rickettsia endosymbiont of Cardiosporidium cionae]